MITVIAAVVALCFAAAAAVSAAVFRVRMLVPSEVSSVRVTLVLPATGPLPGLEDLLAALLAQTVPPSRLIVAVESAEDPAYRRVDKLAKCFPRLAIELVVAGRCDRRGQKCTNILAAVSRLGAADEYVVLIDADIRPQPWWLAALVAPLAAGRADIVNGYRWQQPAAVSPAALAGAMLDRAIATLPRLGFLRLLWGGSLALSRDALDRIDLPATLAHALTEDLVIADRAAAIGLRILTRRALRVPTPLGGTLGAFWRFARRQYQIVHIYRPGAWRLAAAICTADLAARTLLVAAACRRDALAIGTVIALGVLGSAAIEARRSVGRRLGTIDPPGLATAQHLVAWTVLPLAALHASVVWAAATRSPVTWAHLRYVLDRTGRVVAADH